MVNLNDKAYLAPMTARKAARIINDLDYQEVETRGQFIDALLELNDLGWIVIGYNDKGQQLYRPQYEE